VRVLREIVEEFPARRSRQFSAGFLSEDLITKALGI
jgi:hypothetical protein